MYEKLTSKLKILFEELLATEKINATIEARTKSIESFNEKVCRPGKAYENPLDEVTDLSGIRLILRTLDEVSAVGALVEREFSVDINRSVRKIEHLATDQFGYLSEHYIIRVKAPRSQLPEWAGTDNLNAEIQVRTVLQHAWAAVQHSLDYKSECDIPKHLRRRLFRLSALFELADQELDQISEDARKIFAQYAKQVQTSTGEDIEINSDSLKAYLEKSETVAYWAEYIESIGVEVGGIGMVSRDGEMARMVQLSTIGDVDKVLENAKSWGEPYLRDFFINTFGDRIQKGKCSIDRNGVLTIFLIGTFLEVFTAKVLAEQLGWGLPERALEPARKYNPHAKRNG